MEHHPLTFALDIGTRSVVGLILEENSGNYRVLETVIKEHEERSMLDGQIHDVLAVSKVILSVKEQLEKTYGPLKKACVAAAGRALKTERARVDVEIGGKPMIQKEDILHLDLAAVQQAQIQLAEKKTTGGSGNDDCVGYSVLRYKLDDQEIGSLIDQQGETASVEIIATFLPKVVVESLLAALARAGLEMEGLTLEPIAAINVLIPPSMRRLNVALIDIGAGTSDIAITNEGTITAYGMVPAAGDEITEAVSDAFLLDFPLAEKAKRDIQGADSITIQDILGFEESVSREDFIEKIRPAVLKLAEHIQKEILLLNNQVSPKAVMLVGGGSLTPELPKVLAELLGLPENRVAVRGIDAIQNVELNEQMLKGPELVTPIGIAIASKQNPLQYIQAEVNSVKIRMFQLKELTVGDCIISSGHSVKKLYGKPGPALFAELNNQRIALPGSHGKPPEIIKNGKASSLDELVKHGDVIKLKSGDNGEAPAVTVREAADLDPHRFYTINEQRIQIFPEVIINGNKSSLDEIVKDRDQIICKYPETVGDVLKEAGMSSLEADKVFRLYINGKAAEFEQFSRRLLKNGLPASPASKAEHNSVIEYQKHTQPNTQEIAELLGSPLYKRMDIFFDDQPISLQKEWHCIVKDGKRLKAGDYLNNGDHIELKTSQPDEFIFQDIFAAVEVAVPDSGKHFTLLQNGREAAFHQQLQPGDRLEIKWERK
ncbi:cell division protein [Bacillus lacus]|uniref:Cell division protein n=1 Tax=Metabacillus lacus TaxID=1983721 RepID=A0A7X2LYU5_9BACI|nr:cell division FtsA domain-containing protein [Metabacillus lacus]MRX72726.1 cell division protein [Metabacillus lacus]